MQLEHSLPTPPLYIENQDSLSRRESSYQLSPRILNFFKNSDEVRNLKKLKSTSKREHKRTLTDEKIRNILIQKDLKKLSVEMIYPKTLNYIRDLCSKEKYDTALKTAFHTFDFYPEQKDLFINGILEYISSYMLDNFLFDEILKVGNSIQNSLDRSKFYFSLINILETAPGLNLENIYTCVKLIDASFEFYELSKSKIVKFFFKTSLNNEKNYEFALKFALLEKNKISQRVLLKTLSRALCRRNLRKEFSFHQLKDKTLFNKYLFRSLVKRIKEIKNSEQKIRIANELIELLLEKKEFSAYQKAIKLFQFIPSDHSLRNHNLLAFAIQDLFEHGNIQLGMKLSEEMTSWV